MLNNSSDMRTSRDPLVASSLSLVPGLGQIYNMEPRKGVLFMLVAAVNLLLLLCLSYSHSIVGLLSGFSEQYDMSPNAALVKTLSGLGLGSPVFISLALLFVGFVAFAMRDAHDRARAVRRAPIYSPFVMSLAEANSGSYLMHISSLATLLVLCFFFLIPPVPKTQVTTIEFVEPPPKTIEPVKSHVRSTNASKAARDPRINRTSRTPSSRPQRSTSKPQRQATEQKPLSQPQPSQPARPKPVMRRPSRTAVATPSPVAPTRRARLTPTVAPSPGLPRQIQKIAALPAAAFPAISRTPVPTLVPAPRAIESTSGRPAPSALERRKRSASFNAGTAAPAPIGVGRTSSRKGAPTPIVKASKKKGGPGPGAAPSPSKAGDRVSSGGSGGPRLAALPKLGGPVSGNSASNPDKADKIGEPSDDVDHEPKFGQYMADLQRRIKRAWIPPKEGRSKRVIVQFKIHTKGAMSSLRIVRSSGSALADRAALNAVRSAAPFRHLPKYSPTSVDIEFTFDYNVFKSGGGGVTRRW